MHVLAAALRRPLVLVWVCLLLAAGVVTVASSTRDAHLDHRLGSPPIDHHLKVGTADIDPVDAPAPFALTPAAQLEFQHRAPTTHVSVRFVDVESSRHFSPVAPRPPPVLRS